MCKCKSVLWSSVGIGSSGHGSTTWAEMCQVMGHWVNNLGRCWSTIWVELCRVTGQCDRSGVWPVFFVVLRAQLRFEQLTKLAKKTLVIPASSAESESNFSTAGKITCKDRARLHGDTAEASMPVSQALKKN